MDGGGVRFSGGETQNMRHVLAAGTTILIAGRIFTLSAFAADLPPRPMNPPPPDSLVPQSAFFVGLGGAFELGQFRQSERLLAREHPLPRRPSATLRRRSVPPKDQPVLTWIRKPRSRRQFKRDISSILPAPRGCGAVNFLTATWILVLPRGVFSFHSRASTHAGRKVCSFCRKLPCPILPTDP